ncbi:hypothetical protein EDEG_03024 [Edhazardia aedis USNM 41457]|uniref:Uncharacterized protein n=1 Tax=Edhazardia aedis (strain USNM 41457) TaxID=1003232 RepID=J9D4X1_EDHAE|nr:hypothetical protein EDEG_03024 [Edhazardia aedis USNM 41457]|eukprot:EJW02569.1 hypothetical protein EDEG_03024 [Edhazardia aedis USNM 41457]
MAQKLQSATEQCEEAIKTKNLQKYFQSYQELRSLPIEAEEKIFYTVYYMLCLLASGSIEYYILFSKIQKEEFKNKYVKLLLEIEERFHERNYKALYEIAKNNSVFELPLNVLIEAIFDDLKSDSTEINEDEENQRRRSKSVRNSLWLAENQTKL